MDSSRSVRGNSEPRYDLHVYSRHVRVAHSTSLLDMHKRANGSCLRAYLPRHHVGYEVGLQLGEVLSMQMFSRETRDWDLFVASLSQGKPFWSMMTYFFTSVPTYHAGYGIYERRPSA